MDRSLRRGVTILELVVVVLVIGILSAMVVPGMIAWNSGERVKSAAREVADALLLGRSEAIRTSNNHLVVFANALGASQPIVIVDDGPQATANCTIDANEVVHEVPADPLVSWGTSTGAANGVAAPDDSGAGVANVALGSSLTDASLLPVNGATWVLFQSDGIPRLFTPNGGACAAIGSAGSGGGGIYLTNGARDYAVVLRPLGTASLHRWHAELGAWSN